MSDKAAPPPGASGDPSMEDILASIRRILSEDEPPPGTQATEEPADTAHLAAPVEHPEPAAPPPSEKGVLVLDPSMMVPDPAPAPPPPTIRMVVPEADPASPATHGGLPDSGLVAPAAAAAAASSVGALVRTLSERSAQVNRGSGSLTLEDIVRDEIRPILKDWLDHNLPPIVERLVRLEIERVVGRAVP